MKRQYVITIVSWLLVVFCMTVIFLFSSQDASQSGELSGNLSEVIYEPIIETFPESDVTEESIHVSIRVLAHFGLFMMLGASLYNALYRTENREKAFLISILGSIVYATTDEIHQLLIPGRMFELFDIFIDSLGALVGILVVYLLLRKLPLGKIDQLEN